jgi:hypothetical protein
VLLTIARLNVILCPPIFSLFFLVCPIQSDSFFLLFGNQPKKRSEGKERKKESCTQL